jgi:hypothetical protein
MSSQKQTEANRLNSTKSTGPRSVEGKAASRMNALKSGIDAKSQVVRGEKSANLETLKSEYHDRFHPTTPEQRMLVDVLIDSEWLLRRFRMVEAALWEQGARNVYKDNQDVAIGLAAARDSQAFARLQRRVDTAQRNYRTALQDLNRLQAESPEPGPAPQPDPPSSWNEPLTPSNGFVPQAAPTPSPIAVNSQPNCPIDTPHPAKI